MFKRFLLLLLLILLPQVSLAQTTSSAIVIGLIPEFNVFKQMQRYQPLADFLSTKLGREVRFNILSRYGNIIESFSRDRLDGAFFGSFTGAMAIEKLGVTPLVRPVNSNGESTYHGYIYTRKESGIRNIADMEGKRFAFVEKATTAGYVFPLALLRENGVTDLDAFFSEYFFAGSHDASLYAVLDGSADVGASKNTVYELMAKQDPRIERDLVILAESAKVPSNGLCLRKGFDEELAGRMKKILLDLDRTPAGREVLEKLHARGFIETDAQDYQPVFTLSRAAGIDPETYEYRNR